MFQVGTFFTGKDRTMLRSLYRYEGFDSKQGVHVGRCIVYWCHGFKNSTAHFEAAWLEQYRPATRFEIFLYKLSKLLKILPAKLLYKLTNPSSPRLNGII